MDVDAMQEFVTTVISVQLQNVSEGPWSATCAASLLLLAISGFPSIFSSPSVLREKLQDSDCPFSGKILNAFKNSLLQDHIFGVQKVVKICCLTCTY